MILRAVNSLTGLFVWSLFLSISGLASAQDPRPWTQPKTSLPAEYVERVASAFENGVPDPRGGEFREATIVSGDSVQEGPIECKVTGWLLRSKGSDVPTLISWNGVPYCPVKIGKKLSLSSYIRGQLRKRAELGYRNEGPFHSTHEVCEANNPFSSVGVALLLRTGHADLAERIAAKAVPKVEMLTANLGTDFAWFRFNHAAHAFVRGDDALAFKGSQWLVDHNKALGSALEQRSDYDSMSLVRGFEPLHEDLQRRLTRGTRPKFEASKNRALPLDERIAEIIDRLDDVQLLWANPQADPICAEASNIGGPMVEALLDSAQNDKRLSRLTQYKHGLRGRFFVPVKQVALHLAQGIIGVRVLPRSESGDDIAALRKFWHSTRHLTLPERLMSVLADDTAHSGQWQDAMDQLTTRTTGVFSILNDPYFWGPEDEYPRRRLGYVLRTRQNPSLTELMLLRANQTLANKEMLSLGQRDALQMAKSLADWDAPGAKAFFVELYAKTVQRASLADATRSPWDVAQGYGTLTKLIRYRLRAGDESALEDFERMIFQVEPSPYGFGPYELLSPLLDRPEWGDRVARRLFLQEGSKWGLPAQIRSGRVDSIRSLLTSKLPRLASVREHLVNSLSDCAVLGEYWREKTGEVRYSLLGTPEVSHSVDIPFIGKGDRSYPRVGLRVPLRTCDMVAQRFTAFRDPPVFRPELSTKAKDLALQALIKYVRDSGPGLVDKLYYPSHWGDLY